MKSNATKKIIVGIDSRGDILALYLVISLGTKTDRANSRLEFKKLSQLCLDGLYPYILDPETKTLDECSKLLGEKLESQDYPDVDCLFLANLNTNDEKNWTITF